MECVQLAGAFASAKVGKREQLRALHTLRDVGRAQISSRLANMLDHCSTEIKRGGMDKGDQAADRFSAFFAPPRLLASQKLMQAAMIRRKTGELRRSAPFACGCPAFPQCLPVRPPIPLA
jgi:hypothetical protein